MHTESLNGDDYYVFGAGASPAQLSYIGLSGRSPELQGPTLFGDLASSPNEPLRAWAACALAGGAADAFELQRCATRAEAEAAVGSWRRYFRFLGFSLIDVDA